MNKILFFHTKCNIVCDYCHFDFDKDFFTGYGKAHGFKEPLDYKEILAGLEQFRPYHIEFTGGEPTIYKGFRDLVANIPDDCQWAITSNILTNIDNIDMSKCIAWTASWHNKQKDKFMDNILKLNKYPFVSVSVVIPFNRVKEALQDANMIRAKAGVRVNLLRELNVNVDWTDTPELAQLRSMPRGLFNVVEDDIPIKYEFEKGFVCSGGSDYIGLQSDGSVFSCYSNMMNNKKLGDIGTYEKSEGDSKCYDECLGCAEDWKARKNML